MTTPPRSADESLPSGVGPLTAEDPAKIGGHALIGRLGSGGMGIVYLGRDPEGGLVAVKAAYGELTDDELVRRYEAEAACLRRAPAACTVRLLADGTAHVPPYLITEYVEGRSLAQVVNDDGPLPEVPLRALATGVARALAAIHSAGLVHRDLKPANILITLAGPRVIDFGIAQQVGDSGGPTGPGLVVGSPGWIPPERLDRQPATPASDVFGWGCVVGYAGTGRNPFGTGDPDELAQRTMQDPPNLEGLDDSLRSPVTQALNKDPAGRPNAAELLVWLRSPSVREAGNPDFGQTVTPVDPGGIRASDGMPKTGDREEFPRDPEARTPAAAPAVLPRRQVGAARASTDGPMPGSSLAPIARADVGHDEDTDDTRRLRRAPASAPIAVAVTAAAALVAFLVTTAADTDGTPTAPPSSPAPSHGSRRPISGTHPPTTHHTTAPRTNRSSPPPVARPGVPSAPVDQGSNAGGQGNGKGKGNGNGQAKEKNKNKNK
ncbi:MAG TPA: serine/threonine-protein kinase [Actinoallomurus sp.]|jgi:serine/threonine protein kinase